MLGVFLPRFFTHFHMQLFAIGGTLALVRTIDTLAVDLPIGWAMDKIRTPLGRYRTWFVAGTPIVMLGTYMLFNPPPHMTTAYLAGWYLLLWVGVSMMSIASSAWAASLARGYNDRSRLFALGDPGRHPRRRLAQPRPRGHARQVRPGQLQRRADHRLDRHRPHRSHHLDRGGLRTGTGRPAGAAGPRRPWRLLAADRQPDRAAAGAGRPLLHPRARPHRPDLPVLLQSGEGLHDQRGDGPADLLRLRRRRLGADVGPGLPLARQASHAADRLRLLRRSSRPR